MTPPDSPSALLERAAARLEELAAHFADYADAQVPDISRWDSPAESWSYDAVDRNATSTSRAWIETVNPSVAQPLVEWLRAIAGKCVEFGVVDLERSVIPPEASAAVAFARVVLGEPLGHDWFFPYDSHPGARECSRCGAHDDSQPCP